MSNIDDRIGWPRHADHTPEPAKRAVLPKFADWPKAKELTAEVEYLRLCMDRLGVAMKNLERATDPIKPVKPTILDKYPDDPITPDEYRTLGIEHVIDYDGSRGEVIMQWNLGRRHVAMSMGGDTDLWLSKDNSYTVEVPPTPQNVAYAMRWLADAGGDE